jgi:hypothetical protein
VLGQHWRKHAGDNVTIFPKSACLDLFEDLSLRLQTSRPGIGEHNIEFALFLLDLFEETIKIAQIRHVSWYSIDPPYMAAPSPMASFAA